MCPNLPTGASALQRCSSRLVHKIVPWRIFDTTYHLFIGCWKPSRIRFHSIYQQPPRILQVLVKWFLSYTFFQLIFNPSGKSVRRWSGSGVISLAPKRRFLSNVSPLYHVG
jgi:hypothetical protein